MAKCEHDIWLGRSCAACKHNEASSEPQASRSVATRDEEIKASALANYGYPGDREELAAFAEGAQWADAHPSPEVLALVEAAHGCGDGNCVLRKRRGGQHTNGGCHCKDNLEYALANFNKARGV